MSSVSTLDAAALCNLLLSARGDTAPVDTRCDVVLRGLCRLLDAKLVILGRARVAPGGPLTLLDGRQYGTMSPDEQRAMHQYFADFNAVPDPAHCACLRMMIDQPVVVRHNDLVSEAEWAASPHVQQCRWPGGVDAAMYAATPAPVGDHHWDSLSLHRAKGAPPFSDRDRDLVGLLLRTTQWLFDDLRAAARGTSIVAQLTPRLRQALQRFLEGDAEKDAAVVLGLSRHTVHHYSKQLYSRFSVSSRSELLAACRDLGIRPEALSSVEGSSGRKVAFGDKATRALKRMNARDAHGKKQ